jgi:pimeloyl-ACP methyl ester carboxylesterase
MGSIVSTRLVPVEGRTRSLVLGGVGARRPRSREARDRIAASLEAPSGAVAGEGPAERAFREFATRGGNDLAALAAVQRATNPRGDLRAIHVPTLVVAGEEDNLAGSPGELAEMIPGATAQVVPGNHLSAVGRPEFTTAITGFLGRVSPV